MNQRVNTIKTLITIIILVCLIFIGFEQNVQAAQTSSPSVTTPQVEQEKTAVQNNEQNFTKARESFLKKDYKAAAEEIRKSVKYMKTEEFHAAASGKKMLTASIKELDKLAKDVEKGSVTTVNTLDNAFARARDAIASNPQVKKTENATGKVVKDTSSGFRHGLSWTGKELHAATSEVAKGTGFIVGKVIEGTGWLGKHTGNALNSASLKVEGFGKNIQPKKQESKT